MKVNITKIVDKITYKEGVEGKLIKYDWLLQPDQLDESVYDLHLFCISIVRNIIENEIKINEYDFINYINPNDINESTLKDLKQLYSKISEHILVKDRIKAENLIRIYKKNNLNEV